jgi:type VI secretion system protein ImpH
LARVDDERVLDPLGRFRVRLGPFLSLQQYERFLPNGDQFSTLLVLVGLYAGVELQFDLELSLKADAPEACRLNDPSRARLDWTTWLAGPTDKQGPQTAVVSAEVIDRHRLADKK